MDLYRRTGRLPRDPNVIAPPLDAYRRRALAAPPRVVHGGAGVGWRMFRNNVLGDCTVAAMANGVLQRTTIALGTPVAPSDDQVEETYLGLTGGPDSGLVMTTVLSWFATRGWALRDQTEEVGVWGAVDHADPAQLRQTIHLFGSAYVGWTLPDAALSSNRWVGITGSPVDGHCTLLVGYDQDTGTWEVATWGDVITCDDAFLARYLEEAYAVFAPGEWLSTAGLSPGDFDFDALRAALPVVADR